MTYYIGNECFANCSVCLCRIELDAKHYRVLLNNDLVIYPVCLTCTREIKKGNIKYKSITFQVDGNFDHHIAGRRSLEVVEIATIKHERTLP